MPKTQIKAAARAIKDSRGRPTIEVTLTRGKLSASAMVPSGKSAGSREALELRDADGSGVVSAIKSVAGPIQNAIKNLPLDPKAIDEALIALDGTENKKKLGGNAMLGVSIAAARLAAKEAGIPLWKYVAETTKSSPSFPKLFMNMMNGGAHADFALPFQEYIVVVGGRGAREAYARANTIFEALGELLGRKLGKVPTGDEGGYAPRLRGIDKPFEYLLSAAGDAAGTYLAIDAAASEFYNDGRYLIEGNPHTPNELLDIYKGLGKKFHLRSIEDPFDEADYPSFKKAVTFLGERMLVVGDDLTVTNPSIVKKAIKEKLATGMIIKPNQVGTLTEVWNTVDLARKAGWKLVASHRSGETKDDWIADIAVGIGAYGLKAGAPTQKERCAKYDRLIAIEDEM